MRLSGKRTVVTGASSGIGRAIALRFAHEGADVCVGYHRTAEAAATCVEAIRACGREALAVAVNVAETASIDRLVAKVVAAFADIDVWVNVAGADILTGTAADLSDAQKLQQLLDVDLRGTIRCAWAAAPVLQRSHGTIINMSWDLALVGMGGRNPEIFAATKAGVTGFTRALARSLAPAVRVNELAPGWIETRFAREQMSADYREAVMTSTPLRRFGTPGDVAAAAAFLASDEAAFITGQTLKVNGGLSS